MDNHKLMNGLSCSDKQKTNTKIQFHRTKWYLKRPRVKYFIQQIKIKLEMIFGVTFLPTILLTNKKLRIKNT